jgi:hypothetical protein
LLISERISVGQNDKLNLQIVLSLAKGDVTTHHAKGYKFRSVVSLLPLPVSLAAAGTVIALEIVNNIIVAYLFIHNENNHVAAYSSAPQESSPSSPARPKAFPS